MKRNFLLFLACFLSFSGFAQVLDEDFETAPPTPDASGIWTLGSGNWLVRDNRTNGLPNWEVNPQATFPANGGTKAAYINRENTGPGVLAEEWLISPQINIPASHQLRFFTRQTLAGELGTKYQIRVSSDADPNNLVAYSVLMEYTENQLSVLTPDQLDYEEKIINLGFSGNRYIAFVKVFTQPGLATSGDRWLIDDVTISERCIDPVDFDVTNVTPYNATLTWSASAPLFNVEYGPFGFVPGTGTIVTGVTGNAYTIPLQTTPPGPLTPDTQYQFYVTSVCPTSIGELTGPFTFSSAPLGSDCAGPIVVTPLPYSDTGDTEQQGNHISFPSPGGTGCGTTGDFLAGNDVVYAYTVPATTTGLISIEMNPLDLGNTGVFVYANCADIGSNCIAGVANSNTSIRTIPALAVTAGSTIYIVVSSTSDTPTFQYTLDIQEINCVPPTNLSATGTGPNSANLSWQNPGGALSWEVFIQNAGADEPTTAGTTTTVSTNYGVTQLTTEGTTLQLGTPYQYWVRADCGNGTFSPWAGPYFFNTTSCSSGCNYTFTMTDEYGDGWNGFTMDIIQDNLAIETITLENGEGPVSVSVSLCDGPFSIFWNEGGEFPGELGLTVTNSFGQVIFVKEPGEFDPGSEIFAGTVDCQNPMCLPPTEVSFSNVTAFGATIAWTPNGPEPASWDIYVVESGSPEPDNLTTPTANTTENPFELVSGLDPDTEYVIYVRAVCDTPGENPWSEPSEPFTTLPTCPRPTGLTTYDADLTEITFDWTPGGTETEWKYVFVPTGDPMPPVNDPLWISTTTHPVNITTGLTQATVYDFYVIAVCAADDSSVPAGPHVGHTTVCAASEQCIYTFTMTDDWGDGWNGNTMNIIQNGVIVGTIGADFIEGTGPVTAQVALCHGVVFEIFWNNEGFGSNEVGLSVTNSLGQNVYNKPFGVGEQGTTLFTGTGECIAQTCLAPSNIIVTSTGLSNAIVHWTDNNTPVAGSWDILVLPSSAPAPAQDASGWVNTTDNPYNITTGLDPATSYTVYVRSACSGSDKSFWGIGTDFATLVCAPADVCDYTFILTDDYGDGWNGNTMTILQSGIPVATIGQDFTNGEGPVEIVLSLCNNAPFELFWNEGGGFPAEVGIVVENVSGTAIYTKAFGEGEQGTSLFTGTVSCVPAACPKPVQLYTINATENSAQLGWTEAGSATLWEVLILPAGSPAPAPGPNLDAIQTSDNPYTAALNPGTAYDFYVRAICSDADQSNWAGPKTFFTLITNDDCDEAIEVPVNGDQSCAQFVSGTITGATASDLPNDCGGTADDDVWFQFTAVTSAHNINITNIAGSTTDLYHIVYQGTECGSMTQVYCSDGEESFATNLVPGQTYFIRVFSWTSDPEQTSTFDLCIGTIPPPIRTDTTSYSPQQLISEVLFNSTCANVSNITWSTGTDFGSTNGIGYFTKNGSTFPFDYGIVLSSGNADLLPGPNMTTMSEGMGDWPGDTDLDQVLTDQGITGVTGNATVMEFDFVPLTDVISFDFIFASEEYGTFQCQYSDVFAFLLTNTVTNVTTNLAVLPTTTIPISVTTIRNGLYNENCASANEEYFANYYLPPGLPPMDAPINFNGHTVPLTATSPVTPGQLYHIKLAISDFGPFFQDNALDSAVFLKGGSFDIGNIELGDNLLEENGNAVCSGESITLNSLLDPEDYTFIWYQGTELIPDANSATLVVTEAGEYRVEATLNNSTCTGNDSVIVEFYDPILPGQAQNLYLCNPATTGIFNLSQNAPTILDPLGSGFTLGYFTTLEDAQQNNTNADIETPGAYTNISNPQTIYVRASNTATGCYGITTFELILQDLTPQFTLPADFSICSGASGTIAVTPVNFNESEATYSWTHDTAPLAATTSSITVTAPGFYEVTVNRSGCTATAGVTVSVQSQITPTFNPIASVCQNTLVVPVLPTTSVNNINGTWSPATIDASTPGTTTHTFTPEATAPCAVAVTMDVTVNPSITPSFDPIPTLCVGTAAPALPTLSLNSVTGTWLPASIDTSLPGSYTFVFTPDAGQTCVLPYSMVVNVLPAGRVPTFVQLGPICANDAAPVLPLTSTNVPGITGTWSPAVVDNTTTGVYTFTPAAGQCAVSVTMTITVNPSVTASFTQIGPLCQGTGEQLLPTEDLNGVQGSWNPSQISTDQSGTFAYVFTPSGVTCGQAYTMDIVIAPQADVDKAQGCEDNNYVLRVTGGASGAVYSWTNSDGSPLAGAGNNSSAVVTTAGTYHLEITVGGCASNYEFIVPGISCGLQKGISPGDGDKNDFFDLAGQNVRKLEIFNRYGTKVYSQVNYSREWYGQSDKGDELPDGTYYYVIEKDTATTTGWIYINRVK